MFEEAVSELVDLTDRGLHDRIERLELQRRTVETELAAAIAVADARAIYQADAHRSIKGYLKATCNWSNLDVSKWRSVAAAVNALPSIGDAWIQGRIGAPQVALLSKTHGNRRVRDLLPAFLPQLLANAEEMCFEDFAATVAHFVAQADADGAHDQRDDAIEHRTANVVDVGGSLDIRVHGGDAVTTDEIIGIYESFCAAELESDLTARRELHGANARDHDLARTAAQRSHDAIVNIFRMAASAAESGVEGRPASAVVNIVIDSTTFGRIMAAAGLAPTSIDGLPVDPFTGLPASNTLLDELMTEPAGLNSIRCETDRGVPVHPHDVLRAALAGHVRRVVLDSDGHVVDFGRKKRLFEGPARDAAKLLVRRCQHPGCDLPAGWSHVDHNTEWNELGETNQRNAGVLCAKHNNDKHRHKFRRRRATNGQSYTIRADGTIILPVGARTPRFGDPDDRPDTPDEIKEMTNLARERLRAACARDAA